MYSLFLFNVCLVLFFFLFVFFLMLRRPPRSTLDRSSAASDVYKRQERDDRLAHPRERSGEPARRREEDPPEVRLPARQAGEGDADGARAGRGAVGGVDLSLIHISEPTRPY